MDGEMGVITPAVVVIVQTASWFLFKKLPDRKIYKIAFIYGGTILLGTGASVLMGHGWISSFFRSNLLAYAQVFGHQVYKNIGR
jgi:hypothetical protein